MPRLRVILGAIGGGLLLIAGLLLALDTQAGHRFVARQIAGAELQNGLRIEVGRIDGSLFGKADVAGLKLHDTRGLFFEAPQCTWCEIPKMICPSALHRRILRTAPARGRLWLR